MIKLHHQNQIKFNPTNNTLVFNFEQVEFKTHKELADFKAQVTSHLETICKKRGKINCVASYKNIKLTPELLDAFADMCSYNSNNFYSKQTRYLPKETEELKKVFIKKEVGHLYEEVIGNYVLKEKIGKGSFGVVRLATNLDNGSPVAVKIISKKDMDADYKGIEYLKGMETKIHSQIKHPFIPRLIETIETEEDIYMVMGYVAGGKLEKMVEYNPFDEERARKYFKNIIDALEYLHSKNICHRDLCLANVLLDEQTDEAKLIDFGLSEFFSKDFKITLRCGRAMYAAPEMLNGNGYYGPEIDIWASGVCLFVMLTGFVPFRFSANTINGEFSFPLEDEGVSKEVVDLVYGILTVDPKKRFTIQQIKNHPWMKKTL